MHRASASGQQDLELLQLQKTKGLAGPVLVQAMSHCFAHAHCITDTTAGTRAEGLCQQCNLLFDMFHYATQLMHALNHASWFACKPSKLALCVLSLAMYVFLDPALLVLSCLTNKVYKGAALCKCC